MLALALFALLAPIGRAGAQEDAASELEELFGLAEEAPEEEAAKEEVPAEEAAAEEAAEAEVPTTPAEEEAAATGYGAAGLPISV
ncbi:MAG TPA: hypothetical protein VMW52_03300, partial [Phycisphaerae bacterium]|nr:hypothetical protein [Phycisphaerae bacterium]